MHIVRSEEPRLVIIHPRHSDLSTHQEARLVSIWTISVLTSILSRSASSLVISFICTLI